MAPAGWSFPCLIAHRCGGATAPENSAAGLRLAARLGLPAVEFDVMLTRDGEPVLIHDETTERTGDRRGHVAAMTLGELREVDFGRRHHRAYAGSRILSLAEAAPLCRALGLAANIEIKPAAGHEAETGRVVARAAARLWQGAEPAPLLSSFSLTALAEARAAAPELARGLLYGRVPDDWHETLVRLGCVTLNCAADRLRDDTLEAARAAGVPVLCYTVNDAGDMAALLARGVAGMFTDRLDLAVECASNR